MATQTQDIKCYSLILLQLFKLFKGAIPSYFNNSVFLKPKPCFGVN